jgi:hypothetical protein
MKKLLLLSLMFVGLFVSCQKEKTTLESQDLLAQKELDAAAYVTFMPAEMVEDRTDPLPCCWAVFSHIQTFNGQSSAVFNIRRPKGSRFIITLTHVPSGQTFQSIGTFADGNQPCTTYPVVVGITDLACATMGELSGNFTMTWTTQVPDPWSFNGWINCATATSTPVNVQACM